MMYDWHYILQLLEIFYTDWSSRRCDITVIRKIVPLKHDSKPKEMSFKPLATGQVVALRRTSRTWWDLLPHAPKGASNSIVYDVKMGIKPTSFQRQPVQRD